MPKTHSNFKWVACKHFSCYIEVVANIKVDLVVLDSEVKLHLDCFVDKDEYQACFSFAYMEEAKCNLELIGHTFITMDELEVANAWHFVGITSLEVLQ